MGQPDEYLPGHNRRRFDAHLRFVTSEVVRWAGEQFGPVEGPWVASGFSSGAGWAIAAAQRRPDVAARSPRRVLPDWTSGRRRSDAIRRESRPVRAPIIQREIGWQAGIFRFRQRSRDLASPNVAAVIHISTGPFVHSFTGADLRLCPNYPQIYAQAVTVAGQKAAGEHESREEAVISRDAPPSGGPELTLMRIAC
jgi:hypothetical protein